MVVIKISRTAVINPAGVTPVLTVEQIWEGLVEKCRKPQSFVPLMEDCQILREDENGLTRLLTFKNGWGPPGGKAEEDIRYYSPMRVSRPHAGIFEGPLLIYAAGGFRDEGGRRADQQHRFDGLR